MMGAEGVKRDGGHRRRGQDLGRQLAERIAHSPLLGVEVAGFFDDRARRAPRRRARERLLGSVSELADYAKSHRVDIIYIALPLRPQPRIAGLLDELCDTTASIYFVPDMFLFDLIQARMDNIGGMPVLAVCETPFYGVNGMVKRARGPGAGRADPRAHLAADGAPSRSR